MTPPPADGARPARPVITDVCLIADDIAASIDFYTHKLGFTIRSRMPGFVDFQGPGLILALWEAQALEATTGVRGRREHGAQHGVMLACELDSPEAIDRIHAEYAARGVEFASEPQDYPWNARCVYFSGPNGEFWEFFAWYEGGEPGIVDAENENENETEPGRMADTAKEHHG